VKRPGGIITRVEAGSLAAHVGLQPGDELLTINGQPLRDVIDVQYFAAEEWLKLLVRRAGDNQARPYEVVREYGQSLGLEFAHPTFDVDIRRCRNNCKFCFLAQNPRGMRSSLYIKDDDYRYSFLYGNFVTLTNLVEEDWARLEEQRLSPLYVSVHATEPALRRQILQRPDAPDILAQLQRLAAMGIQVHTQLVLVPGLNDGPQLERSLADLAGLAFAPVLSVGVVPVGLTRHHAGPFRPYRSDEMAVVLEQVRSWQRRFRRTRRVGWVYPSDEWYLAVGRDVPSTRAYDGFPQIENGIGMVRQLLDEWAGLEARFTDGSQAIPGRGVLICGALIAPLMRGLLDELGQLTGWQVRALPVINQFYGPTVTVSGLLTGQDVVDALRQSPLEGTVFLPRVMFDATGEHTLDGWTPQAIGQAVTAPVVVAESLEVMVRHLAGDITLNFGRE